jgi:hypothetical protein
VAGGDKTLDALRPLSIDIPVRSSPIPSRAFGSGYFLPDFVKKITK